MSRNSRRSETFSVLPVSDPAELPQEGVIAPRAAGFTARTTQGLSTTDNEGSSVKITRLQPGEKAPANARYQAIDGFGELLNVEVWCEEGQPLPILGVADTYPVSYVRASELTVASKRSTT